MNNPFILFVVIPLIGAFFCLLEKFLPRIPCAKLASISAVVACCILLGHLYPVVARDPGLITYTVGGWNPIVGIQQWFDGLCWLSFALVLFVALMALLFAIAEQLYDYRFHFFYLVMLAGIAGVLLAADLFNLFVCLEILGIASYTLIAYLQKGEAVMASFQYLMLSSLGMAFFLVGIFILYQHTGSLAILDISRHVTAAETGSPQITIAVAALIAGLGVRTAFFRFHTWLPDAHAYAPHPVSAMLSGIHLKVSFLAIWRLVLLFNMHTLQALLLWLGAATAVIGVLWALVQTDCKKLLAWHSISQMGYILAGFGAGHELGLTASFAHTINHGVFKSLLFLSIGSVIHATGERNLKRLGNLGRKYPVLMLVFLAGALSIAGIPPFNGFVSKKLLLLSVKKYPLAYAALWAASIGTVASFIKLSAIFRTYAGSLPIPAQPKHQYSPLVYIPLIMLALFCLLAGVFGSSLIHLLSTSLFGQPASFTLSFYTLKNLLDTLVAVGGGVLLYKLVVSPKVRKVTTVIRCSYVGLDTALRWLVIGFLGLALVSMLKIF